jgi:DHA2 family methylenomycin A resistance protein-like MFS transporter
MQHQSQVLHMSAHQRRTLAVCCIGFFMVLLDLTIVNTALPTIETRLHAGFTGVQWVVDAYTLSFAALLLTGGTFADRFGRKRLFGLGMALFAASSLLCGLSTSTLELNLGRALQGIGGAALAPASLALVATAFPGPRERVRAVSLYAALSSTALGFGPTIGGALVTGPGWRWVFFVNVPIAVGCLAFGVRALTESTNPHARRIDLAGQALSIGALAALTYGLIGRGTHPWSDARVAVPLLAAAALLMGFLAVESRVAEPMLPLRLFRSRAFSATAAITLAVGFALITVPFFFVQYLQGVQGMTALQSGVRSLPFTVLLMVTAPVAGRLANRSGFDVPVAIGAVLAAIGLWTLSRLHPATPYVDIWWRQVIAGTGFGLALSPLSAAALAAVEPARAGLASSVANTARQVGSVLSIALLGAVVATQMHASALASLAGLGRAQRYAAAAAIARSGAQPVHVLLAGVSPARAHEVSGAAYVSGLHLVYLIAALALVVGAGLAVGYLRGAHSRRPAAAPPAPAAESLPAGVVPAADGVTAAAGTSVSPD